jgi:acyl-CoA thioesterase I
MSCNRIIPFGRRSLAAAAMALAALSCARAEVPGGVQRFASPVLPASTATATAPSAMPAVVAPALPAGQHAKPVALHAATAPMGPSPPACGAPPQISRLDHPLLRTAQRLSGDQPLTIVAIGSSSTAGAGASSSAASYPSRLALELKMLFPGRAIQVINRGVNGEEAPQMMARFQAQVIAAHPQLVLWQLGTNSVLHGQPLEMHLGELHRGIALLKNAGSDVVLIDPQYAPRVLAKPETPGMIEQIAEAAKDEHVDLFRRFAVMRDWYQRLHYSFGVFVSPDGLHMNDWGYACWAKLLAAGIAAAANPPVASAALHQPR